MGIIALKKLLMLLGTMAATASCTSLLKHNNKKYDYFLMKSTSKSNDPNLMLEALNKEIFDLQTARSEPKKTHTINDFDVFDLISEGKNQYVFDLTNFSEKHNKITNFSKIQNNHFYLIKISEDDVSKVDLTNGKFSIITRDFKKKYYDFDLVYNLNSQYDNFSGVHLFGTITNLPKTNIDPELTTDSTTDYKCDGVSCEFSLFKENSSELNKNDWEKEIEKVNNFQVAPQDGSDRYFILKITNKTFRHNDKPDNVEITFTPTIKPKPETTKNKESPPQPAQQGEQQTLHFKSAGILYKSKDQTDWTKFFRLI